MDNENIVVSVVCNAYNQEKYIAQALESFVQQQTSFPFEILVHDDASTDNTAQIIRSYEEKYPELIKPIYQTVNQYSKYVRIAQDIQFARAKGKYIAFCEGDDYWTDPKKLQTQYEALEANPEVDICAHQGAMVQNDQIVGYIAPRKTDCIIPLEDVILGGGDYVATNSLMFRTEVFRRECPILDVVSMDYTFQLAGSLSGGMLYLAKCMSAYRISVAGSWTQTMQRNVDHIVAHFDLIDRMLTVLDQQTEHRYSAVIRQKQQKNELRRLELRGDYGAILDKDHRKALSKEPLKYRLKVVYKYLKNKKK